LLLFKLPKRPGFSASRRNSASPLRSESGSRQN
jgi:hypothetical protein